MGFFAPQHVESSKTKESTCVLCIGKQIPIHRTTREALKTPSLMMNILLMLGVTDKVAAGGPGSA